MGKSRLSEQTARFSDFGHRGLCAFNQAPAAFYAMQSPALFALFDLRFEFAQIPNGYPLSVHLNDVHRL